MTKPKILRYCRVSTEDQKKNETIEAQIAQIPKEMARLKLLVEDGGPYELYRPNPLAAPNDPSNFHSDDGYNLESLQGDHAIVEVLQLIRLGMIQAIFIDTNNRILRSKKAEIRGVIIDALTEYDVKLYDYTGEITQGAIMEILAALNADDKKKIGRRTQAGKIRHAKNYNAPTGGVQRYGYAYNKTKKFWYIIEEEAKWLRWSACLSLGLDRPELPENLRALLTTNPKGVSDDQIITAFNEMGFSMMPFYQRANLQFQAARNPTGRMNRNWLNSRFRDDQYCGIGTYYFKDINLVGKSKKVLKEEKEVVHITRPAIFEPEVFALLKARRKERANMYSKNNTHDYLLERVARCGVCDAIMSSRPSHSPVKKNGKKYLSCYYVCPRNLKHESEPCPHRSTHNVRKIDPLIWDQVKAFVSNPETVVANQRTMRDDARLRGEITKIESEVAGLKAQVMSADAELMSLVTYLRKKTIDEAEFVAQKAMIVHEKHERERGIFRLSQKIDEKKNLLDGIERLDMQKIQQEYAGRLELLPFDERRLLLMAVVARVHIFPDQRIEILFKEI
jgi:DNA invertase Pin-like site-specific DNA recombinase